MAAPGQRAFVPLLTISAGPVIAIDVGSEAGHAAKCTELLRANILRSRTCGLQSKTYIKNMCVEPLSIQ